MLTKFSGREANQDKNQDENNCFENELDDSSDPIRNS